MTFRLSAETLGTIVFARFLTMPLKAYDRYVEMLEASAAFGALAPWTYPRLLPGACAIDLCQRPAPCHSITLGEVRWAGDYASFLYHRTSFARQYRFDEAALTEIRRESSLWSKDLAKTLHRLRLVNSRNRLTHAIVQTLLDAQAAYLATGDASALRPLSQASLSRRLILDGTLPLVADAGRLSRLIRVLSIGLANGKLVPLASLFPSERLLNCHRVNALIKQEKTLLLEGTIPMPWSDDEIARILRDTQAIRVSRRTVADIRHQLAIPERRYRSDCKEYLAATEGFSPLVPLTPQSIATLVPTHPGIYEIRSPLTAESNSTNDPHKPPPDPTQVIYIGSTQDLRKRLSDHLRGNGSNSALYKYLLEEVTRVRFRVINDGWREAERQLYRVFCETFGVPPPCNRMSP